MTPFPLGTGQTQAHGIGSKAALLDRAAEAGLPVPLGVVVPDQLLAHAHKAGWIEVRRDGSIEVRDAGMLVTSLRLPRFAGPVAVRSAFSTEDQGDESLAGFFETRLHVDARAHSRVAEALTAVWASAHRRRGAFRRDVLIMEMVDARHAGVAFTEQAYEDDRITYTTGTAEHLVTDREPGQAALLPKLRAWETAVAPPPLPFAVRLQQLLRDVRTTFGSDAWDVEWADDGTTCWLIQIRPITRPVGRNEAFALANHKEILPDLPSRFMTSLIAACAGDLFAYYRRFDDELPHTRPFIEVVAGRPLINLSLLTEMMRSWGLPTTLVTDALSTAPERSFGANLGRMRRKLPVLAKLGRSQFGAVRAARRTIRALLDRTADPGASFPTLIGTLRWLYPTLVTEMVTLTAAMSGPLALLRKLGTLAEHQRHHRTVATELHTDLAPLRRLVADRPALQAALHDGVLPEDADFQAAWRTYLIKHGHRGIYESDIARPRFHEDPAPLLHSLHQPPSASEGADDAPLSWKAQMTRPLWAQATRPMRARERLRYHAMQGFDRIRQALLRRADALVADGVLPHREALWMLTIEEAEALDDGWRPDAAFFAARQAQIDHLAGYRLPDLVYRLDDLDAFRVPAEVPRHSRLTGLSLTEGALQGHAWVLHEPAATAPPAFIEQPIILVARSVDAGWIPTFAHVDGVVVETGSDLSHGSIILREIGLPAVTNVAGVMQAFQNGDVLHLRAGRGIVERLASLTEERGSSG